jgi:DNA (cytosine-5)-methyltransferase 1
MKRDLMSLPLDLGTELIIDNFAGGGGASTALAIALGREPDIAINHDGEALCMHAANHPTTEHHTEDVFMIHPGFVTKNRPIGAAWFSPTCTHFSKAKGGNLLDQKIRGLAWVTVKWGALQMPRMMFLENVEEFLGWGPLDEEGKPIKEHKGRTFKAFVAVLTTGLAEDHPDMREIHDTLGADFPIARLRTGLGYKVEWRILKACDFGAPTIRRRLFMVMRRDGLPIVWPTPTHGQRDSEAVKSGKLLPWLSAASCIDWSIPCPSIFGRKKDLKPTTLRRVGKGFERYTIGAADPYIVGQGGPIYAGKPKSINDPFGTLTTENHRAIVVPSIVPLTHQGSDRTGSIQDPLPTVTCANRGETALAAVSMVQHTMLATHITKFKTGSVGHATDEPLATITSGGGSKRPAGAAHGLGIVAASLVQYYSGGGQNVGASDPMPAIVTKDRIGVTCAYLAAHIVGIDNQRNGDRDAWSIDNPLGTIVTENKHALVTAHIQRDMGRSTGHAATEPLATITAGGGGKAAVVTSNLVRMRGTSSAADVAEPLGTVTAGGMHHAEVRTTLAPAGEYETKRQAIREFLWEYCPSLKGVECPELVMIRGVMMEVVDIGLRMLKPRELANAQGFPRDYILDPLYTKVDKRGKTVTKPLSGSAQVRMIGNSVSPPPAIAILRANFAHEREIVRAA